MSEIKPCLLCDGEAKKYGGGISQETEIVICSKCGASAPPHIWQNRPAENRIKAQGYYDALIERGFQHGLAFRQSERYANKLEGGSGG